MANPNIAVLETLLSLKETTSTIFEIYCFAEVSDNPREPTYHVALVNQIKGETVTLNPNIDEPIRTLGQLADAIEKARNYASYMYPMTYIVPKDIKDDDLFKNFRPLKGWEVSGMHYFLHR